jgi:hypothetical protein
MSLLLSETFVEPIDPPAAVKAMWASLGDDALAFPPPPCRAVSPAEMPRRFHGLLVNRRHMTATLAHHYAAPMRLAVLASRQRDNTYTRLIQLVPQGFSTPVEHALISVELNLLPAPTAREILQGERPVGDVLVRHAIHTRIAPRWFFEVNPRLPRLRLSTAAPAAAWTGIGDGHPCFGRVAHLFCDSEPAIRVLEIISGVDRHELAPSGETANPLGQQAKAG